MLTRDTFIGPWAGLPVAWTDDDEFDEQRYRADVARCCAAGIPGVYTGGTTGEFYAMEFDEFRAVSRATVEQCHAAGTPAMIGCTSTYTLGAARRAAWAAEIGADAVQVALPFWMEMDARQIVPFYEEVARAAPGLALSVYEARRAKRVFSLEDHQLLRDAVPAYVMVKSTAGTLGADPEGCRSLGRIVNVFVGESRWHLVGPAGALGACSSLVYLNPRLVLELWRLMRAGDFDGLRTAIRPLLTWDQWLGRRFEPAGYTDTAYDRLQGMLAGFLDCGLSSRGPYRSATPEELAEARQWAGQNTPELLRSPTP